MLAHHDGAVVLVREHHELWGGAFWNIPSGTVEPGETPVQGAARELAEETGLLVDPGALRLRSTVTVGIGEDAIGSWNFDTHVDDPTVLVQDPDGIIQEARWFAWAEALARLRELPYRPLAAPAIEALTTDTGTLTHWAFTSHTAEPRVSRAPARGGAASAPRSAPSSSRAWEPSGPWGSGPGPSSRPG